VDRALLQRDLAPLFARFARLMGRILASQLAHGPYSDFSQLRRFERTETARRWRSERRVAEQLGASPCESTGAS
jgi:hypothetical protein